MNKLLFGMIGVLLAAIVTIGTVGLIQNPGKMTDATENATAAAETVATDTAAVFNVFSKTSTANSEAVASEGNDREGDEDDDDAPRTQTPITAAPSPQPTAGTYTMAQIATHNNASSCYTAINGNVYDLTSFVRQHPGGSGAILSLCGRDGTAAFSAQHGGQRRPANELASLKIGTLSS